MNLLDQFKFRNVFAPVQQDPYGNNLIPQTQDTGNPFATNLMKNSSTPLSPVTIPDSSGSDSGIPLNPPDTGLSRFRNLRYPDTEEYANILRKGAPDRTNFQANNWGKALAVAAGATTGWKNPELGIKVGTGILDKPYDEAMQDYGTKLARYKALSDLEQAGIKEQIAVETAIGKAGQEQMKLTIDAAKALSDMGYNKARINEINDKIKTGAYKEVPNDLTGHTNIVDLKTGNTIADLGQLKETPGQQDTRKWNLFSKEEGMRQAGARELKQMGIDADVNLENLKSQHAKQLKAFERSLPDKIDTADRIKAHDSAYKQVIQDNPDLVASSLKDRSAQNIFYLDTTDPKKPTYKVIPGYNKDVWEMFNNAVETKARDFLGLPQNTADYTKINKFYKMTPTTETPTTPQATVSDADAITLMRASPGYAPGKENIPAALQEAKDYIAAHKDWRNNLVTHSTTPQVTAPVDNTPPMINPSAFQGGNVPLFPRVVPAVESGVNWIGNIPYRIYGPQNYRRGMGGGR